MKGKIKLNEKNLIEVGEFVINSYPEIFEPKDLGELILDKVNEILNKKFIEVPYLKLSEVKFNTKEKIEQINQDALLKLLYRVLEIHLNRKPTDEDYKKIRISHEINESHKRFVYFPEGKYLGEYINLKDENWFKLVFKFG